jgi:hypothetical protein
MFKIYILKRIIAQQLSKNFWLGHFFSKIKAFSGSYQHRIAKSNTKIVIEGPPRCGNSSALRLVIRNNQSFKNKIATHIHRPFQIHYGIKHNLPMIIMLRTPYMSCISHAALLIQLNQVKLSNQNQKKQLLLQCIKEYIDFLRIVIEKNFKNILIFEDYINNPNLVIKILNSNYDLNLQGTYHSNKDGEDVHVLPNLERDLIKKEYALLVSACPKILIKIQEAQNLYEIACNNKLSYA